MLFTFGFICDKIDISIVSEDIYVYREIKLTGNCYAELNTEIRFCVADARSGGTELLCLSLPCGDGSSRLLNCALRVLRAMARAELIEFFVPSTELSSGSTEAEFLANKYSSVLKNEKDSCSIYVRI